ncbi:hypothetical protein F7725_028156 [Dissostichus mawsoni]|uniref:Uncharacterized protein n=1 Tax=Dissostichus mawsoni TaxID=36200 RepID=A0A7J5XHB2_DISMA|nr:hypothetical protein F7725_028156 [Dissostichus mawsoni]
MEPHIQNFSMKLKQSSAYPLRKIYVVDDTGTEVDEEVFSDILEEKSDILWTIIDVPSVTDSPAPSMCTDTLSLSSQSEECDLSLMSPKRPHVDDAFLMSPKRQHIDDSSSQAKEVLQDFDLLFGAETSSKLLEKWGTLLKAKVMEQAKNLSKTPHLDYLIQCAEENHDEDEEVPGK